VLGLRSVCAVGSSESEDPQAEARVVATVIGTAIVIGRFLSFFENYVVYKSVRKQKHAHVLLRSLSFAAAKIYKVCMILVNDQHHRYIHCVHEKKLYPCIHTLP